MMSLEEMGDKDIQGQNIRTLPTQAAGNLADIDMRALYDSGCLKGEATMTALSCRHVRAHLWHRAQ